MNKFRIKSIDLACIQVVGNKTRGEGASLASDFTDTDTVNDFFFSFIEKSFNFEDQKSFTFIDSIDFNPVFRFVNSIFKDHASFLKQSNNLAAFLYDQSLHPNIKGGEFYTFLGICKFNDSDYNFISLIKSEKKDTFLTIENDGNVVKIKKNHGIGLKNLDKGCIIIDTEEDYPIVFTVDKTNNGQDAHYWTENFLHVIDKKDSYHDTVKALDFCRQLVKEVNKGSTNPVNKAKIAQATQHIMSSNKNININQLGELLDLTKEQQKIFVATKENFEINHGALPDNLKVESSVFKRKKVSKMNIIKHENEFEIKLLNEHLEIETGYDDKKCKRYYKIYFDSVK